MKLMAQLGYRPGEGLGRSSQGRTVPLSSGDMLQDRSLPIGHRTARDPEEQRRRVSSANIDPPECSRCTQRRWPAYKSIRQGMWTCRWCADFEIGPAWIKCLVVTWDGYNITSEGCPRARWGRWALCLVLDIGARTCTKLWG